MLFESYYFAEIIQVNLTDACYFHILFWNGISGLKVANFTAQKSNKLVGGQKGQC